jgi:hypothetical protein
MNDNKYVFIICLIFILFSKTDYTVSLEKTVYISMSDTTLSQLKKSGYKLFVLRAVQSYDRGKPLVFLVIEDYLEITPVIISNRYKTFISSNQWKSGEVIFPGIVRPIEAGQIMQIDNEGCCKVYNNGVPFLFSIKNNGEKRWICGILSADNDQKDSPFCAFILYGGMVNISKPIDKIFLMLSTENLKAGSIIERSMGPGILIDLSSKDVYNVSYTINIGWSSSEMSFVRLIPPLSFLAPVLIYKLENTILNLKY